MLQINSVCGVGSTGKIAVDIHNLLKSKGHESCIAYGRGVPRNCDSTIKIGNKIDNYMHVVLTRIFDRHGFGSKRATRKFIKEIKLFNPDIIHLHNIHGYYLNVGILFDFLKSTNIPTVWTLHDCWSFTGHCAYFDYLECKKWKSQCYKCPAKKEYPKSLLFDNSKRNYSKKMTMFTGCNMLHLVTPSAWLSNIVKESYLNQYAISVIRNGIDIDIFNRESKKNETIIKDNRFIILAVASVWDRRKGLDEYLKLSSKLNNDEVIVMVGLDPDQIRLLPKNMVGMEKTNNVQTLVDLYKNSNIFVNLTLEDNYPTVNIEAAACGSYVVTYATGGSPETIANGYGEVVEKYDIEGVVKAIHNYRSRQNTKVINSNGVDDIKIIDSFDKNVCFLDYISLYEDFGR